jgi:hypothetical protein
MFIWYIFGFGIMHQEKSGSPGRQGRSMSQFANTEEGLHAERVSEVKKKGKMMNDQPRKVEK